MLNANKNDYFYLIWQLSFLFSFALTVHETTSDVRLLELLTKKIRAERIADRKGYDQRKYSCVRVSRDILIRSATIFLDR